MTQFLVEEDNHSPIVCLIGPVEWWWDRPDDPDRFNSLPARRYRAMRESLSNFLTGVGYLVYRPHEAFKGPWDQRAQMINNLALIHSDLVIDMTPEGVPTGKGTQEELDLARDNGIPVITFRDGLYRPDALLAKLAEVDSLVR